MRLSSSARSLLFAASLLASARPAAAEPESPPTAPAAKDPSAADREKSRAAFRRGVAQLRAQDWAGARASFEEAWALVQHPSILLNLGIARLRTDDPVLAERDLVRFLSEDAGAQPDEITGAREALAEARSKIGTLRVAVVPAASRVAIDGGVVAVRSADGVAEARLKAGKHAVAASADGFAPDQRDVDVPAKSETEIQVKLVAKTAEPGPPADSAPADGAPGPPLRKIAGYSLAGVAGVALIVSGVLALEALGDSHDYGDPKSPSFQKPDVKSQGIALRTGADVAFLAALLAGAGAVILLFTDVGASPSTRARSQVEPLTLHW